MAMMTSAAVWHKRLGHASHDKLSNLDFVKNAPSGTHNMFCDSCVKAKFVRLPFPISFIKTKDCLELLHCDIWGKY